jgi:hypothetical protein
MYSEKAAVTLNDFEGIWRVSRYHVFRKSTVSKAGLLQSGILEESSAPDYCNLFKKSVRASAELY